MFHIVLHEPEIPPNTGNAIRLAANTGVTIHLIHPLGFSMDEARLRRAGLDYWEFARVEEHDGFEAFLTAVQPGRVLAFSGTGTVGHTDVDFREGDTLLFGKESTGLPQEVLEHESVDGVVRIPMLPDRRSLNLSNSVAIAVYEAWRQLGFPGAV